MLGLAIVLLMGIASAAVLSGLGRVGARMMARVAMRRFAARVARDRSLALIKGAAVGEIGGRKVSVAGVSVQTTWPVFDEVKDRSARISGYVHSRKNRRERGHPPAPFPGVEIQVDAPTLPSGVEVNFDGVAFEVVGDELLGACLVDGRARHALLPGDSLAWRAGRLRLTSAFGIVFGRVERMLTLLLDLARALPESSDGVAARVFDIASSDSDLPARKSALSVLLSKLGHTQEAARFRRGTHSPAIRLEIAKRSAPPEALEILVELTTSGEAQRSVYELLAGDFDRTRVLTAIRSAPKEVFDTESIVRLIGQRRWVELLPEITEAAERARSVSSKVALAQCFAELGPGTLESKLLEWVAECGSSPDVVPHANALGRVGSVHSVAALRIAQRKSRSGATTAAIETAIELIQARASGTAGTLSLAAPTQDGGLSVSIQAGALTKVTNDSD